MIFPTSKEQKQQDWKAKEEDGQCAGSIAVF